MIMMNRWYQGRDDDDDDDDASECVNGSHSETIVFFFSTAHIARNPMKPDAIANMGHPGWVFRSNYCWWYPYYIPYTFCDCGLLVVSLDPTPKLGFTSSLSIFNTP